MNTTFLSRPHGERNAAESHRQRYHIYRQARAGNFMLEFKTDSAFEVVEYFGLIAPAYDGGAIRIWDDYGQRMAADVEWKLGETELGLSVYHRTDVFRDRVLATVARQSKLRNEMREEIRREVRMSA